MARPDTVWTGTGHTWSSCLRSPVTSGDQQRPQAPGTARRPQHADTEGSWDPTQLHGLQEEQRAPKGTHTPTQVRQHECLRVSKSQLLGVSLLPKHMLPTPATRVSHSCHFSAGPTRCTTGWGHLRPQPATGSTSVGDQRARPLPPTGWRVAPRGAQSTHPGRSWAAVPRPGRRRPERSAGQASEPRENKPSAGAGQTTAGGALASRASAARPTLGSCGARLRQTRSGQPPTPHP